MPEKPSVTLNRVGIYAVYSCMFLPVGKQNSRTGAYAVRNGHENQTSQVDRSTADLLLTSLDLFNPANCFFQLLGGTAC
jgi:hypothetical protein